MGLYFILLIFIPVIMSLEREDDCLCGHIDQKAEYKHRAWLFSLGRKGSVPSHYFIPPPELKHCVGTLINPRFLISSASCGCGLMPGGCVLSSGKHHLDENATDFEPKVYVPNQGYVFYISAEFPPAKEMGNNLEFSHTIDLIKIYDDYDKDLGTHDIAVLRFLKPLDVSKSLFQQICLYGNLLFRREDCFLQESSEIDCPIGFVTIHSWLSLWYYRSTDQNLCYTNGFGQSRFKECKQDTPICKNESLRNIPLSKECQEAYKVVNEVPNSKRVPNVRFTKGERFFDCPNIYYERETSSPHKPSLINIPSPTKHGWCQTKCRDDVKECYDWGQVEFCFIDCTQKVNGGDEPFLFEDSVTTFRSIESNKMCGNIESNMCAKPYFFGGPYIRYDKEGTKYVRKETIIEAQDYEDAYSMVKYTSQAHALVCDEHLGSPIWKRWIEYNKSTQRKRTVATLIGILSRTERNCSNIQEGLHKEIHVQKLIRIEHYFRWITKLFPKGICRVP